MALDLRLQQKMVQQLVMTPQLQQAIKLLQLSHLEMAEVLREEMEQNPVLEDQAEVGDDIEAEAPDLDLLVTGADTNAENQTADSQSGEIAEDFLQTAEQVGSSPEPAPSEVERDINWEDYLDSHSYGLPSSAGGPNPEAPPFEANLSTPMSLGDHLRWQTAMHTFSEQEKAIAWAIIDALDGAGYAPADITSSIAESADIDPQDVEDILRVIQGFEPVGIGARNLRECLLIQAQQLHPEDPLLIPLIENHLEHIEKRQYQAIAKALDVELDDVGAALKRLAQLDPKPGRQFADQEPQYIVPDIYVSRVGDEYVILLNEDGLPRLRISNYYRDAIHKSEGQTKSYVQDKLRSAAWLIRSIHMRQRTIYKVMESILRFQRAFFDHGVAHLKPLILKDVAEDVEMHESTVSRVTTHKYVHTPQGIYELKYFFNSSIKRIGGANVASESVRDHIKRLVDSEDQDKPLSDQDIVRLLRERADIKIARRTVAKYRDMLNIPPSSKRKRVFSA